MWIGLFHFLADAMKSYIPPLNKQLVTTREEKVMAMPLCEVSQLEPCTHEEADGRLLLHDGYAYGQGHLKIMIQASDTDVVVIAIATANIVHGWKLLIAFSFGQIFRYVAVHSFANSLGASCSQGYSSSIPSQAVIPFFYFMELPRKRCGTSGEAQMFSKHFS